MISSGLDLAKLADKDFRGYALYDYRTDEVMKEIVSAINRDSGEIMITGTSLLAFLEKHQYRNVVSRIKAKMQQGGVGVKFLITHPYNPALSTLMPSSAYRGQELIGREVIKSLQVLKDEWKIPVENVRLYTGAPICFGIRTESLILLTVYPDGLAGPECPHLIVRRDEAKGLYDDFDSTHFREWNSGRTMEIPDYDGTIKELASELENVSLQLRDWVREHMRK
jgi:hypothetical protein